MNPASSTPESTNATLLQSSVGVTRAKQQVRTHMITLARVANYSLWIQPQEGVDTLNDRIAGLEDQVRIANNRSMCAAGAAVVMLLLICYSRLSEYHAAHQARHSY